MVKTPFRLLLLCLLICPAVRAQTTDFSPATEDTVLLTRLSGQYQQHYKEELDKLPSKNKKDFIEEYSERWDNVKEKFDKREIYTSAPAQQYLDALVAEIERGNPSLRDHPFHCYFSRTGIPNAAYIGEGIILFNMGLFQRLNNESEAAFVLCHEIGHFLLHHMENSINKYVTTINSEEVQAQLHKIKGSEYHKNEQLEKLVKGLAFNSRRHSRDHESEADSMGVELMRNTRFSLSGALTTLALLNVIDVDTLNTAACLQRWFNSPDYPFKKRWIAREEGLLGGHAHLADDAAEDSLKTHPDCPSRILALGPVINRGLSAASGGGVGNGTRLGGGEADAGGRVAGGEAGSGTRTTGGAKFVVDSVKFVSLQHIFRYEVIEYAYLSDDYTESLFYTLELLQQHPSDAYLVAQVGRLFNGIYAAQKGHTLSKVTDLPAPEYPSNYNLLLQFVQNLYLEELAAINYHYLDVYHPKLDHYAPFRTAYDQSLRNMQSNK